MRMSDWSSDVCSSDLAKPRGSRACRGRRRHRAARPIALSGPPSPGKHCGERKNHPICHGDRSGVGALEMTEEGATMTAITTPSIGPTIMVFLGIKFVPAALALGLLGLFLSRYIAPKSTRRLTKRPERSEEHTAELQP